MTDTVPPTADPSRRDATEVGHLIEQLAGQLVQAGMARMPARVYAAILVSPDGALTAAQIGERLLVSPAAVSKAVQYLSKVHLVHRGYVPESRRDLYRLGRGLWSEMFDFRMQWIKTLSDILADGVETVGGQGSAAGARLDELREYTDFLYSELDGLVDRWEKHRAAGAETAGD